ncbi:MAG: hypothetical protein H7Z14_20160 [Anaerolineae bacterium]|nr:hypothetical protein [Phycisphaerae bacterium]
MPLGPHELIFVIVIPALAALVILFIARRAWLRRAVDESKTVGAWGGPLAVGIAFLIAFPTIHGTLNVFPPKESMSYLLLAVILTAIGGVLDSRSRGAVGLRIAGVFVLACVCTAGVLRFKFRSDWTPSHASTMIIAIGALCLAWWFALDSAEQDPASGSAMPWLTWMICSTLAAVLMMNGSIKYGQLALSLAAAAGAGLLLSLVAKRRFFLRGTAVVFAIIPTLLIISAYYLFDLKPLYVGLLLSAPIAIALGRIIPTKHLRSSIRTLLRIAPTALFMAVILTIAIHDYRKTQSQSDPNDPYGSLPELPRHPSFRGLYQTPPPAGVA